MTALLLRRILALGAAALIGFAPAHAAFDEPGAGARGAGMANAQTAVADDAAAAFFNPAGLVQVGERRLTAEQGEYARGLTDGSGLTGTFFGYTHPVVRGETVISAGFRRFGVSDLIEERTYLIGMGRRLRVNGDSLAGVLSIGANAKMLERAFVGGAAGDNAFNDTGVATGRADPVLAGNPSATTFGFDVGAMYQWGPRLQTTIAGAILNANRPDIGIRGTDRIPSVLKLGISHRPLWGLLSAEVRRAERLAGKTDNDLAIGVERYFRAGYRSAFTLRGGYATGSRGYRAMTVGAGYHLGRFDIDYAFSFPVGNLAKLDGQQNVGLSVRFGAANARPARTNYGNLGLLRAFEWNSLTSHFLMAETPALSAENRSLANRILVRRYTLDDPGLALASREIRDAMRDGREWSPLLAAFTRGVPLNHVRHVEEAVEGFAAGNPNLSLARMAMLPRDEHLRPALVALQVMALGEKAAESYRIGNLTATIDVVRRLYRLLPASEAVRSALRQLQAMDAVPRPATKTETPEVPTPVEAPAPVEPSVEAPVPAPVKAPPVVVPAAQPTPTKTKRTLPEPVKSPVSSVEARRAWRFYEEAVSRDVSIYERIELLESMLMRFGETEAGTINAELKRLRDRAIKNRHGNGRKTRPN